MTEITSSILPGNLAAEARELAASWVAEGYESRDDMVETLELFLADEQGEVETTFIERIIDDLLERHRGEEITWCEPTDPDRLTWAFAELEANGILAREKFWCCQTCGHAGMRDEIAGVLSHGSDIDGYVFFHDQDVEGVVECHSLYLAYGAVEPTEDAVMDVGRRIVSALHAAGLKTVWTGSVEERIAVVELDWKRRRTTQPPAAMD